MTPPLINDNNVDSYLCKNVQLFVDAADQFLRESDKAMSVFSQMPAAVKNGIFGELSRIKHFSNPYFGCGEHAFLNLNGQSATSEEKAQAIEHYIITLLAQSKLPDARLAKRLISQLFLNKVLDLLKIDEKKALSLFSKLPQEEKNAVYMELFRTKEFSEPYWGCAEEAFHNRNGNSATVEQKAQAIKNHLVQRLIPYFSANDPSRMALFSQLPQEIQNSIYGELYLIVPFYSSYWGCAEDAFHDRNGQRSSVQQKLQAFQAYLQRSLIPDARRSFHIQALEAQCPFLDKDYYNEPILKRGEYLIRRSRNYTRENPTYAVICVLGDHTNNDHFLVKFDPDTGDMLCRGKKYVLLDNLLKDLVGELEQPAQPALPPPVLKPKPSEALPSPIEKKAGPVATEPLLDARELLFEQQEAEELFAEGIGLRTKLSKNFITGLDCYRSDKLKIGNQFYAPISGGTQQFSSRPVASCGSSSSREIILLDPANSPRLNAHFTKLRSKLKPGMSTEKVLEALKEYVRKEIFPNGSESEISVMVEKARQTHQTTKHKDNNIPIPLIPIDHFIEKKIGVCRHHALVTAYMLDRLLTEKNPLIEGTVQHMRGNTHIGAHVWVTFIPKKKSFFSWSEKYHLDTLWDVLINFASQSKIDMLSLMYGKEMINDQIKRTNNAAKINGQPEGQLKKP